MNLVVNTITEMWGGIKMTEIKTFSEGVQGVVIDYADEIYADQLSFLTPTAALDQPKWVKEAYETLRTTLRGQKGLLPKNATLPTETAVKGARRIIEKWRDALIKQKKWFENPKMRLQVTEALKVKHHFEIMRAKGIKQPSRVQTAKAEAIIKVLEKEFGKKLPVKTITKLAGKVIPLLGVAILTLSAHEAAKKLMKSKELRKEILTEARKFSGSNIPQGEYYHKDTGWY